eukprot:219300-Amphidinium_carterae.1
MCANNKTGFQRFWNSLLWACGDQVQAKDLTSLVIALTAGCQEDTVEAVGKETLDLRCPITLVRPTSPPAYRA